MVKGFTKYHNGIHLLCVTTKEAHQIIEEVHESSYGPHMNAHMLSRKIMRQGYYWTTMEADCVAHVQKCHQCQVHGDLKHMPPMPLHTMTSPWPFSTWGINIIGKIHPTTSNGHQFILVAIDYFTKWVEATSYKFLNSKEVAQFIQTNIICRYGVPHEIIFDNGQHFTDRSTFNTTSLQHSTPQRSYYNSSTFNTTSLHLTVLKPVEQLRLLIKI